MKESLQRTNKALDIDFDQLSRELCRKYELPKASTDRIIHSIFRFMLETMRGRKYQTMFFPFFGKLGVSKRRKKYEAKSLTEALLKKNIPLEQFHEQLTALADGEAITSPVRDKYGRLINNL